MTPPDSLDRSSPLFWLTLAAILGIVFIGLRFLVAPLTAAAAFGVPLADGSDGIAFAYTKGIRDIFSGLVGLPFLLAGQRRPIAWVLLVATIVPLTDGLIMMMFSGVQRVFLAIHWGAAVYLIVVAFFLFRTSRLLTHPSHPAARRV